MMKKEYIQFSKRIAIVICVFWALYRAVTAALIFVRPSVATALTAALEGVDDVMMVSIGFYTGNSVIEKGIVGYFNSKNKAETEKDEDKEEEPDSNG